MCMHYLFTSPVWHSQIAVWLVTITPPICLLILCTHAAVAFLLHKRLTAPSVISMGTYHWCQLNPFLFLLTAHLKFPDDRVQAVEVGLAKQ